MLWTPVPFPSPDEDSTALIPTSPTGTKHAPARKTHSRKSSRSIQSPPPTTKPYLNRLSTAISSYVPSRAWAPHPFFSILPLLLSFLLNPLLSLSVNTPSFSTFLQLSLTIPPILTLLLPARPSQALSHFRTASILSLLLYVAHTFLAIVDPETTNTHRHSHLLPYLPIKVENHAPKSAVQRILTSSSDHPAIGKLAWDVILTFVSLAIWAGARGLSAGTILRSSGLASKSAISAATSAAESAKSALVDAVVTDEEPASPTRGSVRSRRPRRSSKLASEERQITEAGESGEAARDWKTTDKELDRVWLGEEESEEDWEVTALGWALGVVGGLGTAASSILGAEVVEN